MSTEQSERMRLVKELRRGTFLEDDNNDVSNMMEEAADEIERLRAQLRADEAEIEALKASVAELLDYAADARRTSEYWKGEHNAANAVIERAESELAALRERVTKAPVIEFSRDDWSDHLIEVPPDYIGKRVRLLIEQEGD